MGRILGISFLIIFYYLAFSINQVKAQEQSWEQLNQMTLNLFREGKYNEALDYAENALKVAEKNYGSMDPKTATSLNNLAEIYKQSGNFSEAESLFQRSLMIREEVFGKESPETAIVLNNLAGLYYNRGRYSESKSLYMRVLEIQKKKLGQQHPNVAATLNNIGLIYSVQGQYSKAEPLLKQSLEIREKTIGKEHLSVSQSLNNLAALYFDNGQYSKAEPLYRRSLTIIEKTLGREHPYVAITIDNLGQLYCEQGRYKDAELLYKRSLSIKQKTFGNEHYSIAINFDKIANLYGRMGLYKEAESLHKKSLSIIEKKFGKDHPYFASCLNNLSTLYEEIGRYEDAESLYKMAIKINEKALGKYHPSVAAYIANLSSLYRLQARYSEAETICRKSLEIREKVLGPDHPDTANSLSNLASIYFYQGRYSEATSVCKRALAIAEKAIGKENPEIANILNNLAMINCMQGFYSNAESICKRAISITEEKLGKNHPYLGSSLNNLAAIYYLQNRFSETEPYLKKALVICEKNLGLEHPYTATSINNLAGLYYSQGDYSSAESLHRKALTIRKKVLGNEHLDVSQSMNNLAGLLIATERFKEAFPLVQKALSIDEKLLLDVFRTSSEKQKFEFLATIQKNYEGFLSLITGYLHNKPETLTAGLDAILRRKGIVLDAISKERELILKSGKPEVRDTYEKLYRVSSVLSSLILAGPGKMNSEEYRKRLNELKEEREALEKKLTEMSSEFASKKRIQSTDCKAVSEKLPAGSVLVEYVNLRPRNFKAKGKEKHWGEPEFYAFILPSQKDLVISQNDDPETQNDKSATQKDFLIGKNVCPKLVSLGKASDIDYAVNEFRKEISRTRILWQDRILDEAEAEKRLAEKGKRLYSLVVAPIRKAVGDAKTLYIAPDGDLNLIPFGALQDETGQYLLENYRINYLSSGRDLIGYENKTDNNGKTLIIADPDYDMSGSDRVSASKSLLSAKEQPDQPEQTEELALRGESRSRDLSLTKWNRLPGTRKEADEIREILKGDNIKEFMDKSALEEILKEVRSPRRLHIATHGFFMEDQDDMEMLKAGTRGQTFMSAEGSFPGVPIKIENPLLRCGLVLAGANRMGTEKLPEGCDDGILTALEITGIPLAGTDLVVLSACETGVGKTKCGEGVFGLRRAFQLAGAKTVVMSLWSVPDKQTQELMTDYYQRLKNGESKSEALRNAKLAMMKSGRKETGSSHPFFWASFISVGEP